MSKQKDNLQRKKSVITEEHIEQVQIYQNNLDEDKRKLLLRKRVISLRLNDYASQSGRRLINSDSDHPLYKLVEVLCVFAEKNRNEIISSSNKYTTQSEIDKIINYNLETFSIKIGDVLNFYKLSLMNKSLNIVGNFFFFFVEYFLDSKEKEFGMNYKFNFYKDVYSNSFVKIKQGIYRLERLSSLHEGDQISISKLTVIKHKDCKGKNVFNEKDRVRLSFVEEKSTTRDNMLYKLENRGRIVIRNDRNYILLGVATHVSDTGNTASDEKKKEKTIQIMSFQLSGDDLCGVVLDTAGTVLKYTPFSARVRAVYLAKDEDDLRSMNLDKDYFQNRQLYDEKRQLINKEDSFFVDENKSVSKLNGILTAQ